MPYIYYAIVAVVFIALAVSAGSAGSGTKPKASTLDEFSIPTASKSRLKPKLYGHRWVTGPNVCNYGDYSASPIKK
jgi:hypothetical protein